MSESVTLSFVCNVVIRGKINCLTGLHIGGSKEKMQIGGVDNPVIRDPISHLPYIPGSSLKGKLRNLSEFANNKAYNPPKETRHECDQADCLVCKLFGSSKHNHERGPTRLMVRDCMPDHSTITLWENLDSELLYTELKPENNIDRLTSAADPRQMERVVRGSCFSFEVIISFYDKSDKELLPVLSQAMALLQENYLGGSGTRGYGQVAFRFDDPVILLKEDYKEGLNGIKDKLRDLKSLSWNDLSLTVEGLEGKISNLFP